MTGEQITPTPKLAVIPDSVALPANQSVNAAQINGAAPLMGAGNGGTGSLRVNVASDQVSIPVAGTLQTQTDTVMIGGVNIKEVNAVAPLMGNGVTGTGSLRVTLASDTSSNTNPFLVAGGKTNNSAAPGATNVGVIPGIANAAAQTWTEGDMVLESMDLSGNQRTTLGTLIAGEDLTNGVMKTEQQVTYTNLSASTNAIKSGAGRFFGFIVNSHSSGTLKFWDNTTGATTILLNTITFAAGPGMWVLPVGIKFATGLSVTVGGTIDFTVLWN